MKIDRKLDCTGLFCPIPIANAKIEMGTMKPGEILEIYADDPGFEKDVPVWCNMTGNELIELRKDGSGFRALVKKTGKE